ncbi:MAG: hypothetical protein ACYTGP_05200 [Planctomycetota bacterium]|jgi:hypothetical protein
MWTREGPPRRGAAVIVALAFATAVPAHAAITTIDPFQGELSEDFEMAQGGFHDSLPILFGDPTDGGPNGFLSPAFITSFSSFMGSTVVPYTGSLFSHMTGPIEFTFSNPVYEFGAWFATNGGADGGTVEFFDTEGMQLGTLDLDVTFAPGVAPYTWNGWASDTALGRVRISTNGVSSGFIGVDDVQASFTPLPAPASLLVLVIGLAAPASRRRRRR